MKEMNFSKRFAVVLGGIAAAGLLAAGCSTGGGSTAQQRENRQQAQDSYSLVTNQPIPHYNFSEIRQTLIDAENIAANGVDTTAFFFPQGGTGEAPVFSCPAKGVPVANTAQLSNPDQNFNSGYPNGGTSYPVPQMDPYGIYTPNSSQGTYVVCLNNAGQAYLMYWEGPVMDVGSGAHWDAAAKQIVVTGAPTYTMKTTAKH